MVRSPTTAPEVNATVVGLKDAPRGYAEFDQGASRKHVLDPHGTLAANSLCAC